MKNEKTKPPLACTRCGSTHKVHDWNNSVNFQRKILCEHCLRTSHDKQERFFLDFVVKALDNQKKERLAKEQDSGHGKNKGLEI